MPQPIRMFALLLLLIIPISTDAQESFKYWIAYPMADPDYPHQIGLIHPITGEKRVIETDGFDPDSLQWSPDYTKLSFWANDIHVIDIASGEVTQLTDEGYPTYYEWSPDGDHIAYVRRDPVNPLSIVVMTKDGEEIYRTQNVDVGLTGLTFVDNWSAIFHAYGDGDTVRLYVLDYVSDEITEIKIQDEIVDIDDAIVHALYLLFPPMINVLLVDPNIYEATYVLDSEGDQYTPAFAFDRQFIFFHSSEEDSGPRINLFDIDTKETTHIPLRRYVYGVDISPTGEHLAYIRGQDSQPGQLCVVSLIVGEETCLTDDTYRYGVPTWSSYTLRNMDQ